MFTNSPISEIFLSISAGIIGETHNSEGGIAVVGKRLEQLRKSRGMSQRELAALLGVTNYTVSAYENDRSEPADEIKVRLARLFGVTRYVLE